MSKTSNGEHNHMCVEYQSGGLLQIYLIYPSGILFTNWGIAVKV